MALVTVRIGSMVDIHQYDDGDFDSAIETTEPIKAGTPVDPTDVTRLEDIEGRLLNPVSVVDIDNPTELNSIAGVLGALILAYQIVGATGLNEATLYAYDASGPAVDAPYIMDADGAGDERWIAVGGEHSVFSHAPSHQSGGGDAIKLDDLATPDDNADLDASITEHGLLLKLGGGIVNFLRADGSWAIPAGAGAGLSSYDTGWINRSDWTNVHMGSAVIDYDGLAGAFDVGETITEEISGNTGVVVSDSGSVLVLSDVTGTGVFTDDREITGGDSGATADVNVSTKNTDENVTHSLNAPLSDLLVKVLVSTDGTDANSFEAINEGFTSTTAGFDYGITAFQVDTNNIKIQTGNEGILYAQDSGTMNSVNTEDWYYKIKVFKLV